MTNRYGKYSIIAIAVDSRNKIHKKLKNTPLKHLFPHNNKNSKSYNINTNNIKSY